MNLTLQEATALLVAKVFLYAFLIDVAWVFYVLAIAKRRIVWAAVMSMLMGAPAIFGYMEIFDNRWMAIPYLLGFGTGTVVAMKLDEYIRKRWFSSDIDLQ